MWILAVYGVRRPRCVGDADEAVHAHRPPRERPPRFRQAALGTEPNWRMGELRRT